MARRKREERDEYPRGKGRRETRKDEEERVKQREVRS